MRPQSGTRASPMRSSSRLPRRTSDRGHVSTHALDRIEPDPRPASRRRAPRPPARAQRHRAPRRPARPAATRPASARWSPSLEADQGLATDLLRYANSAACARPLRAHTIRAGRDARRAPGDLAARARGRDLRLLRARPRQRPAAPSARCTCTPPRSPAGAQAIAERTGANSDVAHLAGLLHDVGKLVLPLAFGAAARRPRRRAPPRRSPARARRARGARHRPRRRRRARRRRLASSIPRSPRRSPPTTAASTAAGSPRARPRA